MDQRSPIWGLLMGIRKPRNSAKVQAKIKTYYTGV